MMYRNTDALLRSGNCRKVASVPGKYKAQKAMNLLLRDSSSELTDAIAHACSTKQNYERACDTGWRVGFFEMTNCLE